MKNIFLLLAFFAATVINVQAQPNQFRPEGGQRPDRDEQSDPTRYQGEVYFGYAVGVGDAKIDRFNLQMQHGVNVGEYIFLGVGVGWHYYTKNGDQASIVPIYFSIKGYPIQKDISPYISFDFGYGAGVSKWAGMGGFYMSPNVGVSFKLDPRTAINAGIGLQYQQMTQNTASANLYGIVFRVGVSF